MIIGGAIGSITTDTVYEGGILIEQESKDSGDGNKRDLFLFFDYSFGFELNDLLSKMKLLPTGYKFFYGDPK